MLDKTTALAAQLDTHVKALAAALSAANNTIASQSATIAQLQGEATANDSAADDAGVALLTPIDNEAAAALPSAQ